MAFSQLEPFGYDIEMFGHAQTAAQVHILAMGMGGKKGSVSIADFMPKLETKPKDNRTFFEALKDYAMLTGEK